jgi:hypothetical protein
MTADFHAQRFADETFERLDVPGRGPQFELGVAGRADL